MRRSSRLASGLAAGLAAAAAPAADRGAALFACPKAAVETASAAAVAIASFQPFAGRAGWFIGGVLSQKVRIVRKDSFSPRSRQPPRVRSVLQISRKP